MVWLGRGGEKRNGKDLMHDILEEWELKGEKGERGRMRKTWGFAQNKLRKTKIFVSCATFAKNISGFAQIAQKK